MSGCLACLKIKTQWKTTDKTACMVFCWVIPLFIYQGDNGNSWFGV